MVQQIRKIFKIQRFLYGNGMRGRGGGRGSDRSGCSAGKSFLVQPAWQASIGRKREGKGRRDQSVTFTISTRDFLLANSPPRGITFIRTCLLHYSCDLCFHDHHWEVQEGAGIPVQISSPMYLAHFPWTLHAAWPDYLAWIQLGFYLDLRGAHISLTV